MNNIGLTNEEISSIINIFSCHPQVLGATLYGSRAMGNYQPASDIDIALSGKKLDLSLLTEVEFELDDLMLPYKFDLVLLHQISSQELIDHIERVGIEIYRKEEQTAKT